jgi:hypothetical protein
MKANVTSPQLLRVSSFVMRAYRAYVAATSFSSSILVKCGLSLR